MLYELINWMGLGMAIVDTLCKVMIAAALVVVAWKFKRAQ